MEWQMGACPQQLSNINTVQTFNRQVTRFCGLTTSWNRNLWMFCWCRGKSLVPAMAKTRYLLAVFFPVSVFFPRVSVRPTKTTSAHTTKQTTTPPLVTVHYESSTRTNCKYCHGQYEHRGYARHGRNGPEWRCRHTHCACHWGQESGKQGHLLCVCIHPPLLLPLSLSICSFPIQRPFSSFFSFVRSCSLSFSAKKQPTAIPTACWVCANKGLSLCPDLQSNERRQSITTQILWCVLYSYRHNLAIHYLHWSLSLCHTLLSVGCAGFRSVTSLSLYVTEFCNSHTVA